MRGTVESATLEGPWIETERTKRRLLHENERLADPSGPTGWSSLRAHGVKSLFSLRLDRRYGSKLIRQQRSRSQAAGSLTDFAISCVAATPSHPTPNFAPVSPLAMRVASVAWNSRRPDTTSAASLVVGYTAHRRIVGNVATLGSFRRTPDGGQTRVCAGSNVLSFRLCAWQGLTRPASRPVCGARRDRPRAVTSRDEPRRTEPSRAAPHWRKTGGVERKDSHRKRGETRIGPLTGGAVIWGKMLAGEVMAVRGAH